MQTLASPRKKIVPESRQLLFLEHDSHELILIMHASLLQVKCKLKFSFHLPSSLRRPSPFPSFQLVCQLKEFLKFSFDRCDV